MSSHDILKQFIGAVGQAFQQMDDLAHNSPNPSWSILMDVDNIPDEGLQWFGQFVGTIVDPNLTYNQQRQQIKQRAGWQRGTPAAIVAAVRPLLTGTQTVALVERDTSAYHFSISTYGDETADSNRVQIAIQNNKPAGLQFTYTIIGGSPSTAKTYQNLWIDYSTYQLVYANLTTYNDVYNTP